MLHMYLDVDYTAISVLLPTLQYCRNDNTFNSSSQGSEIDVLGVNIPLEGFIWFGLLAGRVHAPRNGVIMLRCSRSEWERGFKEG